MPENGSGPLNGTDLVNPFPDLAAELVVRHFTVVVQVRIHEHHRKRFERRSIHEGPDAKSRTIAKSRPVVESESAVQYKAGSALGEPRRFKTEAEPVLPAAHDRRPSGALQSEPLLAHAPFVPPGVERLMQTDRPPSVVQASNFLAQLHIVDIVAR